MRLKFGKYRFGGLLPAGGLDYGVYPLEEAVVDAPDLGMSWFRVREAACGVSARAGFYRLCEFLYESIPDRVRSQMNRWYGGVTEDGSNLIKCEFEGWMFVRYCSSGQWFSWAKAADFPDSDLTAYSDKSRYFALYATGFGWYRPEDGDRLHLLEKERAEALQGLSLEARCRP